jgi:kinesin family protein 11
VYGQYSTQQEVFTESIVPIIKEVMLGFNCTVFAYGQTGTGKTHTMEGELGSGEQAGIIPRSLNLIFDLLPKSCTEYSVRLSFVELYNEVRRLSWAGHAPCDTRSDIATVHVLARSR